MNSLRIENEQQRQNQTVSRENSQAYWRKLKERLKKEGNETVTNCHGLKMPATDGKLKMNSKDKIKLFQEQTVRTRWDEEQEKWYFSVVDVVAVLTEHKSYQGTRNYWKVLKHRLVKEGGQSVTICNQLKMPATDGKLRIENERKYHCF